MRQILFAALIIAAGYVLYAYLPQAFWATLGVIAGVVIFALLSVFYKDWFAHDPNKPYKLAWLVKVPKARSVVIHRGGRPTHVLRGDEGPVSSKALFGLWMVYKRYVMAVTGYHVYVPYFFGPTVYALPRYEVREKDGKKEFYVIDEESPRYWSNHVRTELTTWYFEFAGAEIQKIPFTVKGSVQIRIIKGREIDALYKTDSWNVLLDQALNATIRSVVRKDMTLDMVLGGVQNQLWKHAQNRADAYEFASARIKEQLDAYSIERITLEDLGIEVKKVDIIDFEDELSPEEKPQLRLAVLQQEAAKGLELTGRAEAANIERKGRAQAKVIALQGDAEAKAIRARGAADAEAQRKLVEAHKDHPKLASDIIQADALRAFAQKEGGLLDAVLAAFLKKERKK